MRQTRIKVVNAHYAEVGNEYAKECDREGLKLKVFAREDGKLWFTIDNSFNLHAAVNPMTKGRMMVSRPRFDKWRVEFEIIINDEGIPVSVMNDILEQAGKYVGLGDWRPEKKGMFGKFMITSLKEVK